MERQRAAQFEWKSRKLCLLTGCGPVSRFGGVDEVMRKIFLPRRQLVGITQHAQGNISLENFVNRRFWSG